MDVKGEVLL